MTLVVLGVERETSARPPSGRFAHTEGTGVATASASHAEGAGTAGGNYSHAEGGGTVNSGADFSHAEGTNTVTSGTAAHAEGTSATASNTSAHAEGEFTVSSGQGAHAEGLSCQASGSYSHAEGNTCIASGSAAHAEGASCQATASNAHAEGAFAIASRTGQSAYSSGAIVAAGDMQVNRWSMGADTTDATPKLIRAAGFGSTNLTGVNTNVWTIPINKAHRFRIEAVARRTDTPGEFGGWTITGTAVRAGAGTNARFIGTPTVATDLDAAAAAWTMAVSIDTSNATNNFLAVTVTGEAAKTIRWVAALYTTEVG